MRKGGVPHTVVVTGVGGAGIGAIIDALSDYLVVGVDADDMAVGRFLVDKFYRVPMADDPDYIKTLANICKKEKADVVLILVDEEIGALAGKTFPVATSITNPTMTLFCLDKRQFYLLPKHLREFEKKIRLPDTWLLDNFRYYGGEYILKPRYGRGSQGIYKVSDEIDLKYYQTKLKDYLIQRYIEGNEYTVDVLRNRHGEFLAVIPRERIAPDSGLSIKGRTVHDEKIIKRTEHVVDGLGLWGAVNVQWIDDCLIEVNPRLAGSVALSIAAGVNIPAEAVKIYADPDYIGEKHGFKDVTMFRYWNEIFREG